LVGRGVLWLRHSVRHQVQQWEVSGSAACCQLEIYWAF
jgi:hypothetical protein